MNVAGHLFSNRLFNRLASRSVSLLAVLFGVLSLMSSTAWGGDAVQDKVEQISRSLRCPTCQAVSVWESNAPFALQIRSLVERMVREGQSEEQIKSYFVSRYGEWILRTPRGWSGVVWLSPILFITLGGFWLLASHRKNMKSVEEPEPSPKLTAAQKRLVQADLQRWEQLS